MPANLENSAVATGLEKVSFHSSPKERQIVYDITNMWNLKKKKKNITKMMQSHRFRQQRSGYQWSQGGAI